MRRLRNAKIIATLGPASSDIRVIRKMVMAGADVFRLNFSHGTHVDHAKRVDIIRKVEEDLGRPLGIMLDLQGPKFRVGKFNNGPIILETGQPFRVDLDTTSGDKTRISLPHPEIFSVLVKGVDLLVNDGRIRLEVVQYSGSHADCVVRVGGEISDHKGVNIPSVELPLSPLTDKDRRDLDFGLTLDIDWVALSFVQKPRDVEELREIVGEKASIISKIEKPSAIEKIEAIALASDALMVARGDLGVEMPPEEIPQLQKSMVSLCRRLGKPVVIATHMLDSMVSSPVPTRAEASDVANAVYDSADAVMLSAESAAGDFPVESVAMMDRIIQRVEDDPLYRKVIDANHPEPQSSSADAICCAMRRMTDVLSASAIITYTDSGFTCLRAARERPDAPVIALTPNVKTSRKLCLSWGAHPVLIKRMTSVDDIAQLACECAVKHAFAGAGDALVIAAGTPLDQPGTTNLVRIAYVWNETAEKFAADT